MPKSLAPRSERDSAPGPEGVAALLLEPWPLYLARREQPGLPEGLLAVIQHGRVVAADPAVRKAGVSLGMRAAAAFSRVPGLCLVPVESPALHAAWDALLEDFQAWSPWVEPLATGRLLLRVSGAEARLLASAYQARVGFAAYREVALLAALAALPGQVRQMAPGSEAAQTARLPLYLLKGVGLSARSLAWLTHLGQTTLGDLRQWSPEQLRRTLPEFRTLQPFVQGPWHPQVARAQPPERLQAQHSFALEALEPYQFEPGLTRLALQLSQQLQARGQAASRLRVLATACGAQYPATRLSKEPLREAGPIYRLARLALAESGALGRPLERLSLELSGLFRPAHQGSLWAPPRSREKALQAVQARFPEALVQARLLDPYALAADQQAEWVRVFDGG